VATILALACARRTLNAAGARLGFAVAWFARGGLGWWLARRQFRKLDQAQAMARLMTDAAGWKRERSRSTGLWQVARAPLPGETWQRGAGWAGGGIIPAPAWLCPACHHGNHGCLPGRCRCPAPPW
jgi:hypothetical protein